MRIKYETVIKEYQNGIKVASESNINLSLLIWEYLVEQSLS